MSVIFVVPQSEATLVVSNEVMSDGHTDKDLQAITAEKMQEYLGEKETDFYKLYDAAVERITKEIRKEDAKIARKLNQST